MSTDSTKRHSRWFHRKSHAYHNVAADPVADHHEMLDFNMLSPPVLDPDVISLQSCSTPLLRLSDPKAALVSNNSDDGSREEEEQTPKYFQGWRMGVTLCAATTGFVLLVNVVLTVFAYTNYGQSGGLGTLQEGSCRTTKKLSLWLHVVINILSTLLLGASNYCMQCLASPTRKEIDKAHARQVWLDIGVPSVRNLTRISRRRALLWLVLAVSGLPLHLLYNSAVFSTLASQEYAVLAASPALINGTAYNWSTPVRGDFTNSTLQDCRNASNWERLDNAACIKTYTQTFVSAHRNLLAISSDMDASGLIRTVEDVGPGRAPHVPQYEWIFNAYQESRGDSKYILQHASSWVISDPSSTYTYRVQYCLSEPIEERCQVQFSIAIMSVVILCNLIKTLCMLLALQLQRCQPLVTLGDALESFIRRADPATEGMCLAGKRNFSQKWEPAPMEWKGMRRWWFSSASKKRWLTCKVLCLCVLIAASYLLRLGLYYTHLDLGSISSVWQLGFGAVTKESMMYWNPAGSSGLLLTVLLANSPQVLLSCLFLAYNSLFTCMLLADEWNTYARKRKPLRVTSPTGLQRSTYRLQLPYKYGIPLLVISGALHWVVSQSLFLARVAYFEGDQEESNASFSTVGYSCIAILTAIILGAIVVLLSILNGFRRYKPGIPLVGSCSAAISAACHRPKEDSDAADKPVMWGVVSTKDGIGHCCFTSFEVTPPVEGELYGGLDGRK